jgi:hypothetical protein
VLSPAWPSWSPSPDRWCARSSSTWRCSTGWRQGPARASVDLPIPTGQAVERMEPQGPRTRADDHVRSRRRRCGGQGRQGPGREISGAEDGAGPERRRASARRRDWGRSGDEDGAGVRSAARTGRVRGEDGVGHEPVRLAVPSDRRLWYRLRGPTPEGGHGPSHSLRELPGIDTRWVIPATSENAGLDFGGWMGVLMVTSGWARQRSRGRLRADRGR